MTESQTGTLAKTAVGAAWVVGWRVTTRSLGLVSTIVLARLLVPADFGLIAVAMSFSQAVDSFSSLGVDAAVIRERDPSEDFYDTAFTINVLRGIATALIIAAAAEPMAISFGDLRLSTITYVLAGLTFIGAFENIRVLDFRRDFAFHREFKLFVFPRLLQVVTTIGCAIVLHSYWALVAGITVGRVSRLISSYIMKPCQIRLTLRTWRGIASFSFWSWATSIATLLQNRCDVLIIGGMAGPTTVGIYSLGDEIAQLPASEFILPMGRAAYSAFSAARHNGGDLANAYLRIVGVATIIAMPAGVGLSLVADPLVTLALGERWNAARPVVEILAVVATLRACGGFSALLFVARGRLFEQFRVVVVALIPRVLLLILLLPRAGVTGAAAAVAFTVVLENGLYVIMALRDQQITLVRFLDRVWRPVLATGGMAVSLALAGLGWCTVTGNSMALALHLVSTAACGAATYTALVAILWLAAGRPAGAETDLATGIGRALMGVATRLGLVRAPRASF